MLDADTKRRIHNALPADPLYVTSVAFPSVIPAKAGIHLIHKQ